MKKGFNQSLHQLIPDNYSVIYNVGMKGKEIDPTFLEKWKALYGWQRGIIHQPVLSSSVNVNGNASAFLSLLNDLHYGDWNNGWPLIIDLWEAPTSETRYNLDHLRTHGIYITQNYKPLIKPLLRVIVSTWNAWMKSNSTETLRLLQDYSLLLCQPGVSKPSSLEAVGIPAWWEYEYGMYVNDPSLEYAGVVKPKPIVVPVDPPVVPPVSGTISVPKKWKVTLTITGIIEAEE